MAPAPSDSSSVGDPQFPADSAINVRHDMRSSLTVVRGRLQMALRRLRRDDPRDDDRQQAIAELLMADDAVDQLRAYIDRLEPAPDPPHPPESPKP